jgi:hypothetical protein
MVGTNGVGSAPILPAPAQAVSVGVSWNIEAVKGQTSTAMADAVR